MNVEDLITLLQKMPPNMKVVVNMGLNELANGREATAVEETAAYRWRGGNREREPWNIDYYPDQKEDDSEYAQVVNVRA